MAETQARRFRSPSKILPGKIKQQSFPSTSPIRLSQAARAIAKSRHFIVHSGQIGPAAHGDKPGEPGDQMRAINVIDAA
jgi:hypothetical protein